MESFRPLSTSDQLADFLRRQIVNGSLKGVMPGVQQLVRSLGVNSVAVGKAIQQLEREGLVIHQGNRKSRLIATDVIPPSEVLKVGIMPYDVHDESRHDTMAIKQELINSGHAVFVSSKGMMELGMDVKRVAKQAESMNVDAWVVFAGSREVLEWFQAQDVPAFGLHGRITNIDMASIGVRKSPVVAEVVGRLTDLGHRRIVMLAREERRKPHPGFVEQVFLDELKARGIATGAYNIPDWEDSPEGLEKVMRSLFKVTPPTALIIGDSLLVHAVQVHLSALGLQVPKDLSLFCLDSQDSYHWVRPKLAHIGWDVRPVVRRVAQWVKHVAEGRRDEKKTYIKASFCEGQTLGPAPKAS